MSDWHVSASESEGERDEGVKTEEKGVLEVAGLRIPASRMMELLQAVEKRSTTELECLSEVRRKRHGHRKKKHRRSATGESPTHSSGVKSTEEVSETTSDVRSTTSTNITAECRDSRRHDFSKFDPSFDPELDDDSSVPTRVTTLSSRKAPPNHLKEKKLASLEKITADSIKRKQRWHHQLQQEMNSKPEGPSSLASISSNFAQNSKNLTAPLTVDHRTGDIGTINNDRGNEQYPNADEDVSLMEVDGGEGNEREKQGAEPAPIDLPSFRFDEDSDGEMNSEADMKLSILSQINRVENLLDTEALT